MRQPVAIQAKHKSSNFHSTHHPFNDVEHTSEVDNITFQEEAGTSGRMGEYRRLIGVGCGGVPPSEVDQVLGMLLPLPCTISLAKSRLSNVLKLDR